MGEIKLDTMLAGSLMREPGVPQGVAKTGLLLWSSLRYLSLAGTLIAFAPVPPIPLGKYG